MAGIFRSRAGTADLRLEKYRETVTMYRLRDSREAVIEARSRVTRKWMLEALCTFLSLPIDAAAYTAPVSGLAGGSPIPFLLL
jgi:hypothetical protein